MRLEKQAETDRFLTQFVTDDLVRLGRAVTFCEEQIEDLENCRKATREFLNAGRFELLDALAQGCTSPLQALVDRFVTAEEPERNLLCAEPAEDLKREDELGFARDSRIGADEEHPQLVIP